MADSFPAYMMNWGIVATVTGNYFPDDLSHPLTFCILILMGLCMFGALYYMED